MHLLLRESVGPSWPRKQKMGGKKNHYFAIMESRVICTSQPKATASQRFLYNKRLTWKSTNLWKPSCWMPSTPQTSSPTRRSDKDKSSDAPRTPPKPKPHVPSPRRTQSYTPQTPDSSPPHTSARPAPPRRHTSQPVHSTRRPRAALAQTSKRRKRTSTSPIPTSQGEPHVLIPVPIRVRDAQSPSFIRTPSGQHVDFVVCRCYT